VLCDLKKGTWSIREYNKGDEEGIVELFKITGIPITIKDWLWKFRDNPFGSFIWVGEHDGQIVGHVAYLPVSMKIGDRTGVGCQTVDVVIHPKFRRRGMFLALQEAERMQADKRGVDAIYGFPNNPSGHLKVGGARTRARKEPTLVKFLDANKLPSMIIGLRGPKILEIAARILLKIFLGIMSLYSRIVSPPNNNYSFEDIEISTIKSFDDRIDDFWKTVSGHYDVIVIRNKKYLNWRYFEKSNAEYTVLLAEKYGKILGYVALTHKVERNSKTGYIVDILASSANALDLLISKSIEYFKKENVALIRCLMLKNNVCYKILGSCGFIPVGSIWFVTRSHPCLPETLFHDSQKWYITFGDTDTV
jgi:hypothetical protein